MRIPVVIVTQRNQKELKYVLKNTELASVTTLRSRVTSYVLTIVPKTIIAMKRPEIIKRYGLNFRSAFMTKNMLV